MKITCSYVPCTDPGFVMNHFNACLSSEETSLTTLLNVSKVKFSHDISKGVCIMFRSLFVPHFFRNCSLLAFSDLKNSKKFIELWPIYYRVRNSIHPRAVFRMIDPDPVGSVSCGRIRIHFRKSGSGSR